MEDSRPRAHADDAAGDAPPAPARPSPPRGAGDGRAGPKHAYVLLARAPRPVRASTERDETVHLLTCRHSRGAMPLDDADAALRHLLSGAVPCRTCRLLDALAADGPVGHHLLAPALDRREGYSGPVRPGRVQRAVAEALGLPPGEARPWTLAIHERRLSLSLIWTRPSEHRARRPRSVVQWPQREASLAIAALVEAWHIPFAPWVLTEDGQRSYSDTLFVTRMSRAQEAAARRVGPPLLARALESEIGVEEALRMAAEDRLDEASLHVLTALRGTPPTPEG